MKRRKILVLIDSLCCGGAEKSLVSLLNILDREDFDITIMVRNKGGVFEKYVPSEMKVVAFPFSPSNYQRIRYSLALRFPHNKNRHGAEVYWENVGRYFSELKDEYDVAIAYQQGFPTHYISSKVKAKKKIAWINVDLNAAGYNPAFERPFYNKYNYIIGVSEKLKEELILPFYCNDDSRVIVCRDILDEVLIRQMSMECEPIPKDGKLHFVTVGRLVAQKGYDLAIAAAQVLKDHGLDFIWHFVGEGVLRKKLEEKVKDMALSDFIKFEGLQTNPYPFMSGCDVYIQTSKFEGFGLTIGEAKILNKPVVSTNFTVIRDQIDDGVNGLIVLMEPQSIAEGIMRLIQDNELRSRIITNVSKEHNLTAKTEGNKILTLILSV